VERVALISGGNRGLGREVARRLAAEGYQVVIGSRNLAKGEEAAGELGENVTACRLDVTDPETIESCIEEVRQRFGRLDVLVNNAGIEGGGWRTNATDVDLDEVRDTLETNLFGAWKLTQAALPLMRENGYGRIVNLSSGMGQLSEMDGHSPAYRVSKTGLNALTRMLTAELRGENVLVNSCCPGWVRTDMGGPGARLSVEEGGDTPFWLATLPDDGPRGGFFRYRKPIPW
jgi:NAD(P)-dependent dehydrogenase (short-subunit alcohol dehydrogenase family)